MEGRAFNLLASRGGGVEVDEIRFPCFLIQILSHAHNIHGRTYLTAGDVAVIDGEDRVVGNAHIVYQRLTAGAEHLGDASGCSI